MKLNSGLTEPTSGATLPRCKATHTYKGFEIKRWSGPYNRNPDAREPKYYIQTQHSPTGIDWSAENCPKVYSLREAREKINEIIERQS